MNNLRNNTLSGNTLYLGHVGVLLSGFLAGVIAAYYFNSIEFDFSWEIQEARRLGIMSLTVLKVYPKSRDLLMYASVLGFPIIFSIGIWLLWANKERRRRLRETLSAEDKTGPRGKRSILSVLLVAISYLFFSFNINDFYTSYEDSSLIGWFLLAEEGVNLAWAHSILSGGVYGKDFFSLYGPMLVYPLAWAMKIFGETILVERVYSYFLNLIGYGITIFFFYKTVRSTFVLSSLIYFIAFLPMWSVLAPPMTYLRFALGVLPILLTYLYLENNKRFFLPVIGFVIGQSILVSQEVGVCALISVAFFFTSSYYPRRGLKGIVSEGILILAGCLISIAPMLVYFYSKGALKPVFYSLYGSARFHSLGFGALPFPDFKRFLANPLSEDSLFAYWPVFVYTFASVSIIPRVVLGGVSRYHLLKLSLAVFGIFLFPYALNRPDVYHIFNASLPAHLLMFLFFDNIVKDISGHEAGFKRATGLLLLIGLVIVTGILIINTSSLYSNFTLGRFLIFKERFTVAQRGYNIPDLPNGGVFFDKQTAASIIKIRRFLETNTKTGDYVYFFPNEAAYYFIFNRNNPTRYAASYQAFTREQRNELVLDLEEKKPEYVIYSKNTWRIDGIREEILVPEVVEYLNKKYLPVQDSEDVLIAKRDTSGVNQ